MSGASATHHEPEDVFDPIRENRDALETVAEREDRFGAICRYFLALEAGEVPDDYDARLAGLPELGGDGDVSL